MHSTIHTHIPHFFFVLVYFYFWCTSETQTASGVAFKQFFGRFKNLNLEINKVRKINSSFLVLFILTFRIRTKAINNSALFLFLFPTVVVHYASLINSQTVQCECFNQTSDQTKDVCKDNVTECPATDSTKPQACFVLWTTDNQTKERKVTMKGCFTNEQCHRTSCIDTKPLNQYHFCCCLGNMCNTEFDWSPTTAKPEERGRFYLILDTKIISFYY